MYASSYVQLVIFTAMFVCMQIIEICYVNRNVFDQWKCSVVCWYCIARN